MRTRGPINFPKLMFKRNKQDSAPPPADEKVFGPDTPLVSQEHIDELGQPKGFFKLLRFEDGVICETKMTPADFVESLAKTMEKDDELVEMVEGALQRYKLNKHPLGKLLNVIESLANNGGECNCPRCVEKRRQRAEQTAENKSAEKSAP